MNAQREDQVTPLHLACYRGNPVIARLLLDHGAKTNLEDNVGRTALHYVAGGQYESLEDGVSVARILLEHGVDVNARDAKYETPLHAASSCGRLEIARMLLEHVTRENDGGKNSSQSDSEGEYCTQNNLRLPDIPSSTRRRCKCAQEGSLDPVTSRFPLGEARDCAVTS